MVSLRSFSKKKILVTGGRGYIGSNLIVRLAEVDCHITSIGRSKIRKNKRIANVEEVVGDLTLRSTCERVLPADIIFHLAAQNDLDISESDPVGNWKDNVLPLLHLLEIAKKSNFSPIIVFAGTDTEVGLVKKLPVDENFVDDPLTVYDLHKLFCEKYLELYTKNGIVKGVTLRLSNVYGPGPKSGPGRGILNSMVKVALSGKPLKIYGRGNWIRDYVYVGDVVEAFLRAVTNINKLKGQHFVIGTGKGHTVAEAIRLVASRVFKKSGKKVKVVQAQPDRKLLSVETRNMVSDSSLFTKLTGWKPRYGLLGGIDKTIDYYLIHEK